GGACVFKDAQSAIAGKA
nr:extracellular protopectinase SE1, PPase SE1=endo-polygalacturonase {N-terminal} [Trichosporon penicillatum, B2, Peptide Partial, 17 aa] [Dipodascus klebahnii]